MYPICSVEPGIIDDVVIIIKIIGENRIPFGIKSGGHNLNPGFSSTNGILISMKRFSKTIYHKNNQTVDIGPGRIWTDVYKDLEIYNISVIGGRVDLVGVGGFLLGGGYGSKSNQYGLAIDNILHYQLVTPNGGLNKFGIVTNFNVRALPQSEVYGGVLYYGPLQIDRVLNATINFQNNNTDPKAQIFPSLTGFSGILGLNIIIFYDAPIIPENIFKEFEDIPHIGNLQTRSYVSLVTALPVAAGANMRSRFHTVSVTNLTNRLMNKIKELAINCSSNLNAIPDAIVTIGIEPFLSTYFDKSQGGAYPHIPSSNPLFPILIHFTWQLSLYDQIFLDEMQLAANSLLQTAIEDGQDVANFKQIRYINYALESTPLSELYGDNLPRLKSIRQQLDPQNIMNLTGGFKF